MSNPKQKKPPASLLLYIAGLCVTLSGLFAFNYGMEDYSFATMSYSLATVGYVFSYILRVREISLRSVQAPLLVCIILLILANISGNGIGWLLPAGPKDMFALGIKLILVWVAIFQTFLLTSNASILFACLPSMSLLAVVSTTNADNDIQNAFLIFFGAATFMLVHENYLRTHQPVPTRKNVRRDRNFLGAQLQLTAVCLFGSLIIAYIVAVPIRNIGQTLFDPGSITSNNNPTPKAPLPFMPSLNFSEQNVFELGMGPTTESDTPLMRVLSDHGLYWRGTTFSKYTGRSFENPWSSQEPITGKQQDEHIQVKKWKEYADPGSSAFTGSQQTYIIPVSKYDLPASDMLDSHKMLQHITIFGGVFSTLYGAAATTEVRTTIPALYINAAGAILGNVPSNAVYDVLSQVPTQNPELLTRASSKTVDVPVDIRNNYLQLPDDKPEDEALLKNQVEMLIKGKKSNYEKVIALKNFISTQCKYNLQAPPAPRSRDIVAWFLFDKREGYCDSFAAALTVLCRYAGIPSRMASGFLEGEHQADGSYLVRQKHKHVWTEVYFPHIGWEAFDATENTVDISNHGTVTQRRFPNFGAWLTSHGLLPPTLLTVFIILMGYLFKTEVLGRQKPRKIAARQEQLRSQMNQQILIVYTQTILILAKRGLTRLAQQTPDEYAAYVGRKTSQILPSLGGELVRLTALYSRFRYGKDTATDADLKAACEAASTIQTMLHTTSAKDFIAAHKAVSI